MALTWADWPTDILTTLRQGTVIPAHLLALDSSRRLDLRRQRALSRYYIDAGAGGLAVGVHSTQFAIRDVGLYQEVLRLAIETAADWTRRPLVMIAGLVGQTAQAQREAATAAVTKALANRRRVKPSVWPDSILCHSWGMKLGPGSGVGHASR